MTTFRHLKIFVTVADCGSMRKAADALYISQPTISQAIQELEKGYHLALFDRLGKRIYITEAGKLFLSYARQILQSMQDAEEAMQQAAAAPILRIGGSVTVGTVYLDGLVSALEAAAPGIDVRVTVDNTAAIEQMVVNSELDFAIVEGLLTSPELVQHPICQDELVMVVGRPHPFYGAASITLAQLQGQALISREDGSTGRNQFEQLIAEKNIHMTKKWCCTNTEAIKQAVMAGRGIAILSRQLIRREEAENRLRVLPVEGVQILRSFKLILHKNKVLPPPLASFVAQQWQQG
ncbi:MAG: LysR family transcriptional regulator [Gemmiger sp.]|nr:LysR family transcriptional regulator [Gemmiger sp.]